MRVHFTAFVSIEQRAENVLGKRSHVGGQQVLKAIHQFNLAGRPGRVVQPGSLDEAEGIAGTPGITISQAQVMVDFLENQGSACNVFVNIAFNVINSLLAR